MPEGLIPAGGGGEGRERKARILFQLAPLKRMSCGVALRIRFRKTFARRENERNSLALAVSHTLTWIHPFRQLSYPL